MGAPVYVTDDEISWKSAISKPLRASKNAKSLCLRKRRSSHGFPNVTRRDGSTSWRVILLCQRACCVASEPQTMHKIWTGKLIFLMNSPIYFRWECFSACHWGCSLLHAKPQLQTCTREKVWTRPRFRMRAPHGRVRWRNFMKKCPWELSKMQNRFCLRNAGAHTGFLMRLVETVPPLGE